MKQKLKGGEHVMPRKSDRGFGSMPKDKVREIARKGGKAAHEMGTAHEFSSEEARRAGEKGGRN
jgi:general stress protein YciG